MAQSLTTNLAPAATLSSSSSSSNAGWRARARARNKHASHDMILPPVLSLQDLIKMMPLPSSAGAAAGSTSSAVCVIDCRSASEYVPVALSAVSAALAAMSNGGSCSVHCLTASQPAMCSPPSTCTCPWMSKAWRHSKCCRLRILPPPVLVLPVAAELRQVARQAPSRLQVLNWHLIDSCWREHGSTRTSRTVTTLCSSIQRLY